MEQIILVVAMMLSFILGAYVREPFITKRPEPKPIKQPKPRKPRQPKPIIVETSPEPLKEPEKEKTIIEKMLDDIIDKTEEFEVKKAVQMANLMTYTGKPDKYADMRQEEEIDED